MAVLKKNNPTPTPTIHEALEEINGRIAVAKQRAREAELRYRSDQERIAALDKAHLDAQAGKLAGQSVDVAKAASQLEDAKREALSMRDLEIAQRAVELADAERRAFQTHHAEAFEAFFAEGYEQSGRQASEGEALIVKSYGKWMETMRRHASFRQATGQTLDGVPDPPAKVRDLARALERQAA